MGNSLNGIMFVQLIQDNANYVWTGVKVDDEYCSTKVYVAVVESIDKLCTLCSTVRMIKTLNQYFNFLQCDSNNADHMI